MAAHAPGSHSQDIETQREEIRSRVRQFVKLQFPAARKGVSDDAALLKPGIVDSLGILEIVTFVESEYDLQLSDEEMLSEHFESINSLSEFVLSKLRGSS